MGWGLDPRRIRLFFDVGIYDFLGMPASASELLLRLELRVCCAEAASINEWPVERRPADAPDVIPASVASPSERLTHREHLLYTCLAEREGQVLSREEILRQVWGRDATLAATSNIVEVYVRYLRVKLGRIAPGLRIVTHRSSGYSLRRTCGVSVPPPEAVAATRPSRIE